MNTAREAGRIGLVGAALLAVAACGTEGGRSDYSKSPDSGAVAPAARLDTSGINTVPDTSSGSAPRTGRPGMAGDTLSTRGRPAGTGVRSTDTARKRP